jgi:hypothetical protein
MGVHSKGVAKVYRGAVVVQGYRIQEWYSGTRSCSDVKRYWSSAGL